MAQGIGTVICKLCDEPLKIVKTQVGNIFVGCECPDKKYLMEDMDRLLESGELDAVEYEYENDPDEEDDDFDDDDEDEFDDDEDEDDDDEDDDEAEDKEKPKGPSASSRNGPVG